MIMRKKVILVLVLCSLLMVTLLSCAGTHQTNNIGAGYREIPPKLTIEFINKYLTDRYPGILSDVRIMKSEIRDGFYIIVGYTGRGNDVLYYEDSTGLVETDIAEEAYIRTYLYDTNLDDFVFEQDISIPLAMY